MSNDYASFLKGKTITSGDAGFAPVWMPDFLFPFQSHLVEWAIRKGRCALFEDCGLGKSPQELVWAENVVRKTNKPVLLLTPLAVGPQMVREGEKFGIEVKRSRNGELHKGINVLNYESMHKIDPSKLAGCVADESSCVKHFDSKTRSKVTEFMAKVPYRLMATATPAPNDFMELGSSSEALGAMSRNSMLGMFFTNDQEQTQQWVLKGHAKSKFWQWVASWARAIRKPSDFGFDDGKFNLPPLNVKQSTVPGAIRGVGFDKFVARTLDQQRKEKRLTLKSRCEKVASLVPKDRSAIIWCQLNCEGDLLEKLIPGAVQVQGSDRDEVKEERLNAFGTGQIRVLVTKSKIGGFGLNYQHCSDVFYFPSWSHEQYYQAIRRCWRFGQKKPVTCNLVYSEAESWVVSGMLRKERQAEELYAGIISEMGKVLKQKHETNGQHQVVQIPSWLK